MRILDKWRSGSRSLRMVTFTAMLLFVIFFVVLFTTLVFLGGSSQIRDSVLQNTESLISNTGNLVDHACSSLLTQMNAITESSVFYLLQYSILNENYTFKPRNCITLNNTLSNFYQQNSDIVESVFIYVDDNSILQYLGSNSLKAITFDFEAMYPHCSDALTWLNPEAPEAYVTIYPQHSTIRFAMLLGTPETKTHGILLVNIRNSYMADILNTQSIPDSSALVLTYYSKPVAFNEQPSVEQHFENAQLTSDGSPANDPLYQTFTHNLTVSPMLSLCLSIPRSVFSLNLRPFTFLIPIMAIILALFGLFISYILSRELNRPLELIASKMALVGSGQLSTSFDDVHGFQEIDIITKNAGILTRNIAELVDRVYHEQKKKRKAELAALQSQINPHFLYNALYATRQLCETGETPEAIQMIDYLATFYRIGISRGKSIIPLSEELAHVNSYLGIQQLRHEDILSYDIDIDETLQDCRILKLTLQPLVENAIHHGIEPMLAPGTICITAESIGHDLLVYVSDNGIGMSEEKLHALQTEMAEGTVPETPTTYGLKNVHQRLRITFGESYGLTICSKPGEGTLVTVRIPLEFDGEEELK